jgi:hypothetical protein
MVILYFLPESPRWLAYNDRSSEALQILAKINGRAEDHPEVQLQYQEIQGAMLYEKGEGRSMGFREVIRTKATRKRLILALSIAPLAMLTGSNIIT